MLLRSSTRSDTVTDYFQKLKSVHGICDGIILIITKHYKFSHTNSRHEYHPHLLGCQWMLLPSHSDHQFNPKLMNVDGFDAFGMHVHEYNSYMRTINKIVSSRPKTIRHVVQCACITSLFLKKNNYYSAK